MIENSDLKKLILQYSSYDLRIYDNTSIFKDLQIKDELAFDFIEAYSKQFDVDISSFNFTSYLFSDKESTQLQKRRDLTVGDLIQGIAAGELNDDVISFDENDPNLAPTFTTKKIILGVILVLITFILLSIVALYV